MHIQEKMNLLVHDKTVDEEFFGLLTSMAVEYLKKLPDNITQDYTAESLAGAFICALYSGGVHSEMQREADVYRELVRWFVWSESRQESELWQIVSSALRVLEEQGAVQREENRRRFNNKNDTRWYLTAYAGKQPDWSALDQATDRFPVIQKKGEHDRVLKPEEARACVLAVLEACAGELPMEVIVKTIAGHVPMLHVDVHLDATVGESYADGDGGATSLHDVVAATTVLNAHNMLIAEDAKFLAGKIWELCGTIESGKTMIIQGQSILCCYYIPKKVAGQQVVMKDFGPTSTVQDVVTSLEDIMREWMPSVDARTCDQALEEWQCATIAKGVLAHLSQFCSENGFCPSFYSTWSL